MTSEEFYKQELSAVQAAILKLSNDPTVSHSVSSANGGSFSASYADLKQLQSREKELKTMIASIYRTQNDGGEIGLRYPIYCGG